LSIARRIENPLVLIPGSDEYVQFVSRHRGALSASYRFLLPEAETVETLLDKARFAALVDELEIRAPGIAVVDAVPDAVVPDGFDFPLIIKPLNTFADNPLRQAFKVMELATWQDWKDFFSGWSAGGQVAVQEQVVGDDGDVYVYGGLWKEGRALCGFTGRKIRQSPPGLGSTVMAVCEWHEDVFEQSEALLRRIGYTGLCDVEFKRDRRDGQLWIIEVNPRQGLWHRLGRNCGIDLIQSLFRLLTGDSLPTVRQRPGISGYWSYQRRDVSRLASDLLAGRARVGAWLMPYLSFPEDAVFSWSDPGPWAGEFAQLALSLLSPKSARRRRRTLTGTPRSQGTRVADERGRPELET
jgi:predicted ATP-grasp superfamily ATP-dependent carboligase